METNKIIGYILLTIGLLLIIGPLWQTFNIFMGNSTPPKVFAVQESLKTNSSVGALDMQGQVQNALIKIMPIDLINNTLNLTSWMVLMFILIYGGGKIADIGIKLIKS